MSLSTELGKKSAKGSFNLFLGVVTQNIILAIGAIIVGRLLGSDLYGLYALSLVPAEFVGLFVGLGIRQATIKYVAQYKYQTQQEKVKATIIIGLLSSMLIGLLLSILCFSLSELIAALFNRPDTTFLIQLISLTIFSNGSILAFQSVIIGIERTDLYSAIIIFKAILQSSLGPLFILTIWSPVMFGSLGVVVGYLLASYSTCIFGLLTSYFFIIRRLTTSLSKLELLKSLKVMLTYGIPLYISRVVTGFLGRFLSLMMPIFASNILIGNYRVSLNFTVLIIFFATPIATVLFPMFSKLDSKKDIETLRKTFRTSAKYTSFIIIPVATLVIALSKPAVSTLYGSTYELAPFFLSLSVLTFFYSALGQYSINAILNGQGETRKNMILALTKVAVGLPLSIMLVDQLKIVGLIIASLASEILPIILGSIWVKKLYNVTIDWSVTVRILIIALVAGLATFYSVNLFTLQNWMQLLVGTAVLSSIFIILTPLFKVINSDDIQNLQTIFSESGSASIIVRLPLRIMLKLCR